MQRSNRKAIFKSTLALGDFVCVCGAFMVAYWLRYRLPYLPPPPPGDFGLYLRFSLFISFATFVTLYSSGLYRLEQPPPAECGLVMAVRTMSAVAALRSILQHLAGTLSGRTRCLSSSP